MEDYTQCGLVPETDPAIIKMFAFDYVSPTIRQKREELLKKTDEQLSADDDTVEEPHKVHYDGSHYVTSKECEKKGTKRKKTPATEWNEIFELVYAAGKSEGVKPSNIADYIYRQMKDGYCYPIEDPKAKPLRWFIRDKLFNKSQAKAGKARRFKYKSGFVRWNYFITITYSDKLIGEREFYRSLKKQFGNLHTRHGWKVAGAFERGKKTNRLHFHALVYVPDGELMGELIATKTFDFDEHRMKVIHQNPYFSERYGRNDFEAVDSSNRALINKKISYIQKYIQKSGDRMFYSRGIPCHVIMKLRMCDVAAVIETNIRGVTRNYVFYDGVIKCADDKESEDESNTFTT